MTGQVLASLRLSRHVVPVTLPESFFAALSHRIADRGGHPLGRYRCLSTVYPVLPGYRVVAGRNGLSVARTIWIPLPG